MSGSHASIRSVQQDRFIVILECHMRHAPAPAAHGRLGRAAAEWRLTRPALSRGIQAFAAARGVRLFRRQNAGVALTAFGRLLVQHGAKPARAEDEAQRELEPVAGLGLGPHCGVISDDAAAGRLGALYPKLQLHGAGRVEITRGLAEGRSPDPAGTAFMAPPLPRSIDRPDAPAPRCPLARPARTRR
jgi:hypothetical protein